MKDYEKKKEKKRFKETTIRCKASCRTSMRMISSFKIIDRTYINVKAF